MNETNNWDGTVNKEMFDLSQVGSNFETFNTLTKRYLINCLVGNAHLTGEGSLLDYFDELMEEVVEEGEIAIIEVAKNKYLATVEKLNESLLKEAVKGEGEEVISPVIEYEFTLLDNTNLKYNSEDISKYVIFKFNKEGTSHLAGLSFWTKRLSNILQRMEKEMFMNEKRLIFFSPETPSEKDTKKWLKQFTNGIMTFITFDESANPDKQAISEGKQGINPNLVKFQVYEPKEFQEEEYRNQFAFVWNNMERAYGIRHDTLQEKEERASVTEVFSSQANFDAQEKKIYRLLWKSIQEYNKTFDNEKGNYQFKYGRIGN